MIDKKAHDPKFARFWFNKISNLTRWEEPDWKQAWQIRIERSEQTNNFGQWKEYFDPSMKVSFYYNESENKHQFRNPYDPEGSSVEDGNEGLAIEGGPSLMSPSMMTIETQTNWEDVGVGPDDPMALT